MQPNKQSFERLQGLAHDSGHETERQAIARLLTEYAMKFRFTSKSHECPRCGSHLVRLSKRRTSVERVVCRLLFVRPYRCNDCNSRFFGFGAASTRKSVN